MSDDIIDRIDELVDEQLAGGEPRRGYDFGNPDFPRCPHCDRHWHGLPITARIAAMYALGVYDEDYQADADDTPVICHGSMFIGPMPETTSVFATSWVDMAISQVYTYLAETLFGSPLPPWMEYSLLGDRHAEPRPPRPSPSQRRGFSADHLVLDESPFLISGAGAGWSIVGTVHEYGPEFTSSADDTPIPLWVRPTRTATTRPAEQPLTRCIELIGSMQRSLIYSTSDAELSVDVALWRSSIPHRENRLLPMPLEYAPQNYGGAR